MSPDMIDAMIAADLTREQMAALLKIELAKEQARKEARRAGNAERQRRFKERKGNALLALSGVSETLPSVTASRDIQNPPTHAEPEPNKTTYPTTSEAKASSVEPPIVAKPKSDRAGCIEALSAVLSPSRAIAVVEHRAKLRKPLTPHAAALLAKSLSQARDPDAAADEMIERGWQGWRSDWGRDSRAPPPRQAKRNSLLDGLDEIERRFAPNVQQFPRIAG